MSRFSSIDRGRSQWQRTCGSDMRSQRICHSPGFKRNLEAESRHTLSSNSHRSTCFDNIHKRTSSQRIIFGLNRYERMDLIWKLDNLWLCLYESGHLRVTINTWRRQERECWTMIINHPIFFLFHSFSHLLSNLILHLGPHYYHQLCIFNFIYPRDGHGERVKKTERDLCST